MADRLGQVNGGDRAPAGACAARLAELDAAVHQLLVAVANTSPDAPVDDAWTVRDVLAHIAFWHESFARNVDDLAQGRPPRPLRGRLADLNARSVADARDLTPDEIADRLRTAHAIVSAAVVKPSLGLIPYRVGSRPYPPEEHLTVVRDHIRAHVRSVERASDAWRRDTVNRGGPADASGLSA